MAERVRQRVSHLLDYPKRGILWLHQRPPYPIDENNTPESYWRNRPVLRWRDPHIEELKDNSIRVFVTGHAVDHEMKGKPDRFPAKWANILKARGEIHAKLESIYAEANEYGKPLELVFCSATTGTDLLALEWALGKIKAAEDQEVKPNISVRSFLGYDKETFIKDSVELADHDPDQRKYWRRIFDEVERRGLLIEPEFRNPLRRLLPRPSPDAPKGKRFKDQIKRAMIWRYGSDKNGDPLYKGFDEMNDMMVRYLRPDDYALALWDGSEPFGRGGTVYALDAAAKRIKNDDNIIFINPEGIIHEKRLARIREENEGQPVELNMVRVRKIKGQVEARMRTQPPARP